MSTITNIKYGMPHYKDAMVVKKLVTDEASHVAEKDQSRFFDSNSLQGEVAVQDVPRHLMWGPRWTARAALDKGEVMNMTSKLETYCASPGAFHGSICMLHRYSLTQDADTRTYTYKVFDTMADYQGQSTDPLHAFDDTYVVTENKLTGQLDYTAIQGQQT